MAKGVVDRAVRHVMFQTDVDNSSDKMSIGKMREKLLYIYTEQFSIHGEMEIGQFIGKLC